MSTSSLTVVPGTPHGKAIWSLLSVHLFTPASQYLVQCTVHISLQVKFHWHYVIYSSLLSALHIIGPQICAEPQWLSEGLIRIFSFRPSNQKARLIEESRAKPQSCSFRAQQAVEKGNWELELSKKQKANKSKQNSKNPILPKNSQISQPNYRQKHWNFKAHSTLSWIHDLAEYL